MVDPRSGSFYIEYLTETTGVGGFGFVEDRERVDSSLPAPGRDLLFHSACDERDALQGPMPFPSTTAREWVGARRMLNYLVMMGQRQISPLSGVRSYPDGLRCCLAVNLAGGPRPEQAGSIGCSRPLFALTPSCQAGLTGLSGPSSCLCSAGSWLALCTPALCSPPIAGWARLPRQGWHLSLLSINQSAVNL